VSPPDDKPYSWSAISREQMQAYVQEAARLLRLLEAVTAGPHPFALGLLGAALIQSTCKTMNADPDWFAELIKDPTGVISKSMIAGGLTVVKRGQT
jgi:hypothetical protein